MKPGYKQTEVGVIPEEWDDALLDNFAKRGSGHTPDKKHPEYWNGRIKWISLADSPALDRVFIDDTFAKVTPEGIANSSAVLYSAGTVVLSRDAGVGKSAIMRTEMAVSQHFMAWHCGSELDNHFLYYWLQSAKPEFERIANGSTIKTIGLPYFQALKFPHPPLPEQRAIATALSDVDGLLGGLDRLIAKNRDLKQAAMQQLLTGQTRLPGFHAEWEDTTLGELATFLSGGTPSRSNDDYWTGDIPWISASSLRCFEIWRSDSNVTRDAVAAGSKMAPVGSSLLLVRGSALHNEILCGLVTKPVCFNQDVKALVPRSHVMPSFLTLFIRGTTENFLSLVSSAGNTAGVLDTKLLKAFAINLPPLPEQTAIASVLTDMDAELAALTQRREKTRALKQAMMQELLTGRIRLVSSSGVTE